MHEILFIFKFSFIFNANVSAILSMILQIIFLVNFSKTMFQKDM